MDYRMFEERLLDLMFTTNAPLTSGHVAYYLRLPIQEAEGHLQHMVTMAILQLDSDEAGNLHYVYPMRPALESLPAPPPPADLHARWADAATQAQLAEAAQRAPRTGRLPSHPAFATLAGRAPPSDRAPLRPAFPVLAVGYPLPGPGVAGVAASPSGGAEGAGGSRHQRPCPFCSEPILATARKCRHCHERLDTSGAPTAGPDPLAQPTALVPIAYAPLTAQPVYLPAPVPRYSATVAALLSLCWPGAGQIYSGRVGAGVAWMVFTILGYCAFFFPGLILHGVCVVTAANVPRE